jgi:hypothetical protein
MLTIGLQGVRGSELLALPERLTGWQSLVYVLIMTRKGSYACATAIVGTNSWLINATTQTWILDQSRSVPPVVGMRDMCPGRVSNAGMKKGTHACGSTQASLSHLTTVKLRQKRKRKEVTIVWFTSHGKRTKLWVTPFSLGAKREGARGSGLQSRMGRAP